MHTHSFHTSQRVGIVGRSPTPPSAALVRDNSDVRQRDLLLCPRPPTLPPLLCCSSVTASPHVDSSPNYPATYDSSFSPQELGEGSLGHCTTACNSACTDNGTKGGTPPHSCKASVAIPDSGVLNGKVLHHGSASPLVSRKRLSDMEEKNIINATPTPGVSSTKKHTALLVEGANDPALEVDSNGFFIGMKEGGEEANSGFCFGGFASRYSLRFLYQIRCQQQGLKAHPRRQREEEQRLPDRVGAQHVSSFTHLHLSSGIYMGRKRCLALAAVIPFCVKLQSVSLVSAGLSGSCPAFKTLLRAFRYCSHLVSINLSRNPLGDQGGRYALALLSAHAGITRLELQHCGLCDLLYSKIVRRLEQRDNSRHVTPNPEGASFRYVTTRGISSTSAHGLSTCASCPSRRDMMFGRSVTSLNASCYRSRDDWSSHASAVRSSQSFCRPPGGASVATGGCFYHLLLEQKRKQKDALEEKRSSSLGGLDTTRGTARSGRGASSITLPERLAAFTTALTIEGVGSAGPCMCHGGDLGGCAEQHELYYYHYYDSNMMRTEHGLWDEEERLKHRHVPDFVAAALVELRQRLYRNAHHMQRVYDCFVLPVESLEIEEAGGKGARVGQSLKDTLKHESRIGGMTGGAYDEVQQGRCSWGAFLAGLRALGVYSASWDLACATRFASYCGVLTAEQVQFGKLLNLLRPHVYLQETSERETSAVKMEVFGGDILAQTLRHNEAEQLFARVPSECDDIDWGDEGRLEVNKVGMILPPIQGVAARSPVVAVVDTPHEAVVCTSWGGLNNAASLSHCADSPLHSVHSRAERANSSAGVAAAPAWMDGGATAQTALGRTPNLEEAHSRVSVASPQLPQLSPAPSSLLQRNTSSASLRAPPHPPLCRDSRSPCEQGQYWRQQDVQKDNVLRPPPPLSMEEEASGRHADGTWDPKPSVAPAVAQSLGVRSVTWRSSEIAAAVRSRGFGAAVSAAEVQFVLDRLYDCRRQLLHRIRKQVSFAQRDGDSVRHCHSSLSLKQRQLLHVHQTRCEDTVKPLRGSLQCTWHRVSTTSSSCSEDSEVESDDGSAPHVPFPQGYPALSSPSLHGEVNAYSYSLIESLCTDMVGMTRCGVVECVLSHCGVTPPDVKGGDGDGHKEEFYDMEAILLSRLHVHSTPPPLAPEEERNCWTRLTIAELQAMLRYL